MARKQSKNGIGRFKPSSPVINFLKSLWVGFDTEYVYIGNNTNLCLSYQFYIKNTATGKCYSHIYYPDLKRDERLSLKELFIMIFKVAGIPLNEIDGYYINLICHFAAAEWSMLSDRKEIAHYFEFLYKTLVTRSTKEVTFSIDEVQYNISFDLSDTMLLLPGTHKSLDKATSLLDESFHKIALSEQEISHMDVLLAQDKARFEEYALHDAKITLFLYIKLQEIINEINGTTGVRYLTIGSATVTHFKKFCKEYFPKGFLSQQFPKGKKIDHKSYNLVRRAYMGGLNASYYIGEAKKELFLDIDFSSAYPTSMGLLQVMEFPKVSNKEINTKKEKIVL